MFVIPPPLSAHSFPVYGTVVLLVTPTPYHSRLQSLVFIYLQSICYPQLAIQLKR